MNPNANRDNRPTPRDSGPQNQNTNRSTQSSTQKGQDRPIDDETSVERSSSDEERSTERYEEDEEQRPKEDKSMGVTPRNPAEKDKPSYRNYTGSSDDAARRQENKI